MKKSLEEEKNKEFILAADLGTTAVKVSLVNRRNEVLYEKSREIQTCYENDKIEQDPLEWYEAFCEAAKELMEVAEERENIAGISFSGQMQDLIMIPGKESKQKQPRAILYSDSRAQSQADFLLQKIGEQTMTEITGNHFDGSIPFAKLLWVKEYQKEAYEATEHVVFSSKDYIIYRLTGKFVTDVTTASTSGLMNIRKKEWAADWLEAEGIDPKILPRLCYPSEEAGFILEEAAEECGLLAGTAVYAGIGDAGASTLASGLVKPGEYNINLGTSGWVAQVSDHISAEEGVFNLAYIMPDTYVNVTPFYNAGNVHKWMSGMLTKDNEQEDKYEYINQLLSESRPGSHGLLFLPYLNGERYPVSDAETRGAYIGITPETTKQDMARACLEGVAFSLKTGFVSEIGTISLIGGGACVPVWCQIFADVLDHEIMVCRQPDYMTTIAAAVIGYVGEKSASGYEEFLRTMKESEEYDIWSPNPDAVKKMEELYPDFCRIYPAVKEIRCRRSKDG